MKKKSPTKKIKKISYEKESVSRWNTCQKIAKLLYRSDRSLALLTSELTALENEI